MATKKRKKSAKPVKLDASIEWFSRLLPNLDANKGLTIAQRKAKAENDLKAILATVKFGQDWKITASGITWIAPHGREKRFKVTVRVEPRRSSGPGPGNPPVAGPKQPPPGM